MMVSRVTSVPRLSTERNQKLHRDSFELYGLAAPTQFVFSCSFWTL